MDLTEWARRQGIHPQTACNWFHAGTLPVPAVRVNQRTILVSPDTALSAPVEAIGIYAAPKYLGAPLLFALQPLSLPGPCRVDRTLQAGTVFHRPHWSTRAAARAWPPLHPRLLQSTGNPGSNRQAGSLRFHSGSCTGSGGPGIERDRR